MHLVMIGGSDAGISAALRARELDPGADVTVVVPSRRSPAPRPASPDGCKSGPLQPTARP